MLAPDIDPVAISLGPVKVHWYGLMYVFGLLALWFFAARRAKQPDSGWTAEQGGDFMFYGALGVILGFAELSAGLEQSVVGPGIVARHGAKVLDERTHDGSPLPR